MSALSLLCIALLMSTPVALAQEAATNGDRARELLRRIDDLWRGKSSHAVMEMQVRTAHYKRSMTMEAWSLGTEKTLVRILSPKKEKGTATLKSGTNAYSYLPKTNRTIRLTSAMMGGSWMGSHFTNDDLVKESRRDRDYDATISFEGKRDGRDIIEFTLIPKPEAAVVWGKITLTITDGDWQPVEEVFYDEDMVKVRTITFTEIKTLAGKSRPSVMLLQPEDKPEEYTKVVYRELQLDIPMKESFFSLSQLQR